jgi:hypothetical protein
MLDFGHGIHGAGDISRDSRPQARYLTASSSRVQLFGALFFELFRNCPRKLLSFGDVTSKSAVLLEGAVGSTDRVHKSLSFSPPSEEGLGSRFMQAGSRFSGI